MFHPINHYLSINTLTITEVHLLDPKFANQTLEKLILKLLPRSKFPIVPPLLYALFPAPSKRGYLPTSVAKKMNQ